MVINTSYFKAGWVLSKIAWLLLVGSEWLLVKAYSRYRRAGMDTAFSTFLGYVQLLVLKLLVDSSEFNFD